VTFAQLVELWEDNFAPSEWRRRMLNPPLERWGRIRVRSLQPEAIGGWLHQLEYAPKTKTHILQSFRQVLSAGVDWGYLSVSPARAGAFKAPGSKRLREIRPFESWDEVLLLASEMGPYSPLVRFVCATGLRSPSEWLTLRWAAVDLPNRLLTVDGTKSAAAQRTIPLSARAVEALEDQPRRLRSPLVFHELDGDPYRYRMWRKREWHPALIAAGLRDRNPYEMRHTFATLALQAGASVDDVSQALGHESIDITLGFYRKWTRPMLERLRDVLDTIDRKEPDGKAEPVVRPRD